jgi:Alpha/beta hydrolase family
MLEAKLFWFALAGALIVGVIAFAALRRGDVGQGRFFADQSYHFQTLRVLNDVPSNGADTAEVLQTIKHVRSGDAQGWFRAWSDTGDRVTRLAAATTDRIAKGRALLRAHNYYRTAEFFLSPDDARRPVCTAKNIQSFYAGLDMLAVAYQQIKVPYGEGHHLEAVYYPAATGGPSRLLIVLGGGYDSTLEELYFVLVKDAHEHGYAVLTYDGPGQGSALRDQGLTFTHQWEKPTAAVIDAFLAGHSRPPKMVIVGMSMGGYLAPRAAAFDERFDGVVAYDVFFDLGATARRYVPAAAFWLRDHGFAPSSIC